MSDGDAAVRRPQPAATIILVREHRGDLQVYLLRRSPRLRFMPGLYVFPGGRVDASDRDILLWQDLTDLTAAELRGRYGDDLDAAEALGYAIASVRETFEEAGVFLARTTSGTPPDATRLEHLRREGRLGEGWLAPHVRKAKLALTLSALRRWARWITPPGMQRRYDSLFLVAEVPPGQTCHPDGREAETGEWICPAEALARNVRGEIPLSPPTIVTLHELTAFPGLAALEQELPCRRQSETVAPRLVPLKEGSVIVEPWDPEFSRPDITIPNRGLENRLLPAGEPFSRIWFNGELWRPIAV